MPTPACLATAVIGAPGSATNTDRAESRMRWSLRAASAGRRLIGPWRRRPELVSVMKMSVAEDWNKPFRSDSLGTEDFVPVLTTGESDVISTKQDPGPAPGLAPA